MNMKEELEFYRYLKSKQLSDLTVRNYMSALRYLLREFEHLPSEEEVRERFWSESASKRTRLLASLRNYREFLERKNNGGRKHA